MINVMTCIIQEQREFFDKGIQFLRPLTLQTIARQIGVHESTVSRVTNNKYVQTPRGIFELKFFFSSGSTTDDGEDVSARTARDRIKNLIAEEDVEGPPLRPEDRGPAAWRRPEHRPPHGREVSRAASDPSGPHPAPGLRSEAASRGSSPEDNDHAHPCDQPPRPAHPGRAPLPRRTPVPDRALRAAGEAHVILDVQKSRHVTEIVVRLKGRELVAREESHEAMASIDAAAIGRLGAQLKRTKKQKTKVLKDGTRPNGDDKEGAVRSAARAMLATGRAARKRADEEEAARRPRIVPARGMPGRPVTLDEAADELLANGLEFLAFVNSVTDQMNVLYKRKDGNLGLIAARTPRRPVQV